MCSFFHCSACFEIPGIGLLNVTTEEMVVGGRIRVSRTLAGHCGCAELVSCGGLGSAGVSSSGRVFFVQSLVLILQLRL